MPNNNSNLFRPDRPGLKASARPVELFVQQAKAMGPQAPGPSRLGEVAKALSQLNPAIQGYINDSYQETSRKAESQGQQGFQTGSIDLDGDPDTPGMEHNRQSWKELISQAEKDDLKNGTNNAHRLRSMNLHKYVGLVC